MHIRYIRYCLLVLTAGLGSQAAEPTIRETLIQLTEQRFAAMIRADRAALDEILADDCIFAYADGRIRSKREHIQELVPISMTVALADVVVRDFGDTALISYRVEGRLLDSTGVAPRLTSYHSTDVFHRDAALGGRWRLVAVQAALNRPESQPVAIAAEDLAAWTGTYRSGSGENLRVWLEGGHLFGARETAPAHEYLPRSKFVFFTRESGAAYFFSRDIHNRLSLSILLPDSGTLAVFYRQRR